MKIARYPGLVLFVCLISPGLFAQRPSVGKEPSWIVRTVADYSLSKFPPGSEDGYMNLSTEKQVDLGSQSIYRKKAIKIITESGVQNGSEVSVSYDPSYERLVFHTIHIIRGGRIIDKLDLSKIKTVKEETELDRSVYNGTVTSMLILEDTRKGDIIEYSYSLLGFNPVFNNKYSDFLDMQYSIPLGHIFYAIICPAGRQLHIRNQITEEQPVIGNRGGAKVYQWELHNVPGLRVQDELPSWYDPYPIVMVSEYGDWNEVCRWAMPLFTVHKPLSLLLEKKVGEIRADAGSDMEKRILQALRFVQDEIRYQGIEMGSNSHKPNRPDKVLAQRFGDCKDKSLLLCTLLHELGIDAAPVLINTTAQHAISGWLPSPLDFNHTTVRVRLGARTYWFDATISLQRGGLNNIAFPDYQCGLVLTDTTSGLTVIPLQDPGQVIARERFILEDNYGAAHLEVVTRYTGSFADDMRDQLNSDSKANIQQSYQNFYNDYYEGTKNADSLIVEDNDTTGMITTHEAYNIDKLWEVKNGTGKASFYGLLINSILKKPKERDRKMPVDQTYPAHYTEELEIQTPEDWDFDRPAAEIRSGAFAYKSTISTTERTVRIKYEYQALQDHIPVADAPAFFSDYDKLKDDLGYALTKSTTISDTPDIHTNGILTPNLAKTILCMLLIGAILFAIRRRR